MFKELLSRFASILPWGMKQAFQVATIPVGALEDHGLRFAAAGVTGSFALFAVLRGIVALQGPIPVTPGVLLGLELWAAFMGVVLVHTCVDTILLVCGERPIEGPALRWPSFFKKK